MSNNANSDHQCKIRFVPNVGYTGIVTSDMQLAVFDENLFFAPGDQGDFFWSNAETIQMQIRPAPKTQPIAATNNRKLVIENQDIKIKFNPATAFTSDSAAN